MELENLLSDVLDGVVPIEKYPLVDTYKEGPHYDTTGILWYNHAYCGKKNSIATLCT